MIRILLILGTLGVLAALLAWNYLPGRAPSQWSQEEIALIQSLSLSKLPNLPPDAGNAVADSTAASRLGQSLYFDRRLSLGGGVSCATCHQPEQYFTDGLPLAMGAALGPRHTPSLVGLAYSPWFYWDGRKDSQWAQALAPLEASHEHGLNRLQLSRRVLLDPALRTQYAGVFGAAPELPTTPVAASPAGSTAEREAWQRLSAKSRSKINRVFSNLGKALAAYQRRLLPGRSRFDDYADSIDAQGDSEGNGSLSRQEIAGLNLFIGKAQCVNCHNGPLLTNFEFHNTGVMAVAGELPPMGRYDGVRIAREDPFNCLGEYSDATAAQCLELQFARDGNELVGAHKTPTLRNVAETAPYMHGGQIADLGEVIEHYNRAPVSMLSHNEAKPLGLRRTELRQLEAFLHSLTAPLATDPDWLEAP